MVSGRSTYDCITQSKKSRSLLISLLGHWSIQLFRRPHPYKKERLSWKNHRKILEGHVCTYVGIGGPMQQSLKDAIGDPMI